jgi:hypothetical protein
MLHEHGKKRRRSLSNQKGNTTMARAKEKPAHKRKTLVRGPDGALYVLTKTDPPVKLTEIEAHKVNKIVEDAEKKLARIIDTDLSRFDFSGTRSVHVTIPEVFME